MVNPADIRCLTSTFCRRQTSVLPFNRVEPVLQTFLDSAFYFDR